MLLFVTPVRQFFFICLRVLHLWLRGKRPLSTIFKVLPSPNSLLVGILYQFLRFYLVLASMPYQLKLRVSLFSALSNLIKCGCHNPLWIYREGVRLRLLWCLLSSFSYKWGRRSTVPTQLSTLTLQMPFSASLKINTRCLSRRSWFRPSTFWNRSLISSRDGINIFPVLLYLPRNITFLAFFSLPPPSVAVISPFHSHSLSVFLAFMISLLIPLLI